MNLFGELLFDLVTVKGGRECCSNWPPDISFEVDRRIADFAVGSISETGFESRAEKKRTRTHTSDANGSLSG